MLERNMLKCVCAMKASVILCDLIIIVCKASLDGIHCKELITSGGKELKVEKLSNNPSVAQEYEGKAENELSLKVIKQ